MMQWRVLLQKEWRDHVRSLKILWIPLVFVLYGVMQPVTLYYMEDIMKAVGNMPEGFDMGIADVTSVEVIASTVGQFHLIVALIFVLSFMGIISKERKIVQLHYYMYDQYLFLRITSVSGLEQQLLHSLVQ